MYRAAANGLRAAVDNLRLTRGASRLQTGLSNSLGSLGFQHLRLDWCRYVVQQMFPYLVSC